MAMKSASKRSGPPRLRKAEACFPCNRTKHRCDAAQPACTPCVKTGKYCEYRHQRRGAPPSVERVVQFDPKRLPMIPGNGEQPSTITGAPYNLQPSQLPAPPLLSSSDIPFLSRPQTIVFPKPTTTVIPTRAGLSPTSPPKSSLSSATTKRSSSKSGIVIVPPLLPPFNPQPPHALRPLLTLEPDPMFPRNPPPLFIDGNGRLRHARWDDI